MAKVEFKQNKNSSILKIEDASEQHIHHLIDGLFASIGVAAIPPIQQLQVDATPEKITSVTATVNKIKELPKQATPEEPDPAIVEAVTNFVNELSEGEEKDDKETTLGNAMRKGIATLMPTVVDSRPEHYRTGVMKELGKPDRYKCRYKCTRCENEGNRYIKEGERSVYCHACNQVLITKKAVRDSKEFKADTWQNWYIAGDMKPSAVLV